MLQAYLTLSYSIYLTFVIMAWVCGYDERKNGIIQYFPGMYISEKLLLTLTFGTLVFPPFIVIYFSIKIFITTLKKIIVYTKKVFKSNGPWFIQKTTQKQEGDI